MFFVRLNDKVRGLTLNQFLGILAAASAGAFILIALIGLLTGKASFSGEFRKADPLPSAVLEQHPESKVYDMIGQIRSPTKPDSDDNYSVAVISPWLEYDGDDREFYEELDTKLRKIKAIIYDYVSSRTEKELRNRGEINVKSDILDEINASLVLGRVSAIYFRDYEFIK
ncbi:MAG: flagellar basal body-associated FliL family protein [Treponema sp.]|nr:flagellar basal body-associated FliL family protein [Treponema sp.]